MDTIESLLTLLENPFYKKCYEDFKKSLIASGLTEESEALQYLIDGRFVTKNEQPDRVHTDAERR